MSILKDSVFTLEALSVLTGYSRSLLLCCIYSWQTCSPWTIFILLHISTTQFISSSIVSFETIINTFYVWFHFKIIPFILLNTFHFSSSFNSKGIRLLSLVTISIWPFTFQVLVQVFPVWIKNFFNISTLDDSD